VRSISVAEFDELLVGFERTVIHLEMRDAYGTAVELPYLAKWVAGEPDDLAWLQGWCDTLRAGAKVGKSVRRARVVSEPLSEYQRWSHSIAAPMVDAGEDIRWIPRQRVSSIAFPGNDCYVFDDRQVVFLTYSGDGLGTDRLLSTDQRDVELCRTAFEAAWELSIPHRDYRPV
jgi:hypothetical protein